MRQDDAFDISQLLATKAIAAGELNRIEPELRRIVITSDMSMSRLDTIA